MNFNRSGRRACILTLALGLVTTLGGCGLDETLHRMDLATYRRACVDYGFSPGTTPFAQCMQQQAALRAQENQANIDRAHLDNAVDQLGK